MISLQQTLCLSFSLSPFKSSVSRAEDCSWHSNWETSLGRWFNSSSKETYPLLDFPCGSAGKASIRNVGDLGSIPGLGRSAGEGKGYPLQYSGLENSMGLYSPWGSHRVGHDWSNLAAAANIILNGEKLKTFPLRLGLWRKLSAKELMLLICGVGEDSWESLGLQGDPTSPFWRRSALGFLWKEWC